MNMKTNVIFKNGVNLVCERVNKASMLSFLYFDEPHPNKATELMNGWEFLNLTLTTSESLCRTTKSNDLLL